MLRNNISCPQFKTFLNPYEAIKFIKTKRWKDIVIKASGLAAGKGVIIPSTQKEAVEAVKKIMIKRVFQDAGKTIVIQKKVYGQEISVIAFSDGKTVVSLPPSQDHKSVYDGDKGPNTGGMGVYAPAPFITNNLMKKIHQNILQPTIDGMRKEDCPFIGALFAGLIITKAGPTVLEFNVRFGDPETQPQMMLLKSDLLKIIESCLNGSLKKDRVKFNKAYSTCVILASNGYPDNYKTGKAIDGLSSVKDNNIQIFHAGTKKTNGRIITSGGRVLGVTARALELKSSINKAYKVIGEKGVRFDKMHFRKDIGAKALRFKKVYSFKTKTKKLKLIILISGSGTTMESILKAVKNGRLSNVEPLLIISSSPEAGGLQKARNLGIKTAIINPSNFKTEKEFGTNLLDSLKRYKPDLISQNGWLPHAPANVIERWQGKIINQHPAPLDPEHKRGEDYDFGGKGMYGITAHAAVYLFRKLVMERKPKWMAKRYIPTEATVHMVTEDYDKGPVIQRNSMDIVDGDTPALIQKRLLPLEHKTVIQAISDFSKNKITIKKRPKPLVRSSERDYLLKAKQKAIKGDF